MYVTLRGAPENDEPPAPRGLRRRVPGAVLAFGTVSLLTDISSESVAAVLPLYLTAVLGMGPLAYGFFDGIYQGVSAAVRVLGGWWADSTRRPKWVAFVGYLASAVSRIGLLFATGFGAITAVITADRLGKGLRTGPRDALIATASDPADLGRNFGVHRAMDTFGALIGPLIAFAVLAAVPFGLGGFQSVFVFSAAFAILGLVVLAIAVPDLRAGGPPGPPDPTDTPDASPARGRVALRLSDLSRPELRRVLVVAGLLGLVTVGDGFIYLALSDRGSVAATYFPLLFVGTNVAYLALAIPLGKVADRIGRGLVFLAGHAVLLGVYALAASTIGGIGTLVMVLLLLGTFYAATDGVLSALATQTVPEESRASGIAAAQTVVALSRFVSSIAFGLMWQLGGRTEALWVMSAALVVALVGATWFMRPMLQARRVDV
ncbi:MFS transporter [Microlunatus aurantiacus]|uniref:MFS transporter n=1 Tax=Microlunatus aurantiacus TaxID=446786 RepID=A0ABP7DRD2_9ACTN